MNLLCDEKSSVVSQQSLVVRNKMQKFSGLTRVDTFSGFLRSNYLIISNEFFENSPKG